MGTFLTTTWLMFRMHLGSVLRSKRMLICLLLAAGPPLIAWFPAAREDAREVVGILGMMMSLQVIAPLIGLIAGSAVVTEEVENRTITYVFTRPVHRSSLFLGRWFATLVMTSTLLGPSSWAVTAVATTERAADATGRVEWVHSAEERRAVPIDRTLPEGMVQRYVWAAVLAGAVYSLLTAALGVFVRRSMIVGLGYAFAVEVLLANVPGGSQKFSVQYYLRGILTNLAEVENAWWREFEPIQRTVFLSPAESSTRLLVVILLAVGLSTWWITRRQFVLTS